MAKENTTRFILLGLLSHEPMSGYDLKKRIDYGVSRFWNIGYAQIYPTLAELAREGLVLKADEAAAKGPPRNVYTVTDAGREALTAWLALPVEKEYTKYELLLKLFFSAGLPAEASEARIRAFAARQAESLAQVAAFRQELSGLTHVSEDHFYYYLTTLFGERVYGAYLAWADEALALLAARRESGQQAASAGDEPPSP